MKIYELNYLIPQTATEEEARALQERINSFIVEKQGLLEKSDMGKRRLGCPIKKQRMAYLAVAIFGFDPEKIKELEDKIKSEDKILRHIIVVKRLPKARDSKRRMPHFPAVKTSISSESPSVGKEKIKKVEIEEIEKKLEEILGE